MQSDSLFLTKHWEQAHEYIQATQLQIQLQLFTCSLQRFPPHQRRVWIPLFSSGIPAQHSNPRNRISHHMSRTTPHTTCHVPQNHKAHHMSRTTQQTCHVPQNHKIHHMSRTTPHTTCHVLRNRQATHVSACVCTCVYACMCVYVSVCVIPVTLLCAQDPVPCLRVVFLFYFSFLTRTHNPNA